MLCYVYAMLCCMFICIAPLTGGYSEVLSAWQAGAKRRVSHVLYILR